MIPSTCRATALRTVAVYGFSICIAASAWALQKTLKTKAHTYPNSPIAVKRTNAELIETYTAPTQYVAADAKAKTSRVKYANRAGMSASVFVVQGDTQLANTSSQAVEALSLTIVALDAFHQPLQAGGGGAVAVQQVAGPIARGAFKRHEWQQVITSPDVYEVAVIVTRVRFVDGTVWTAPSEELLDIF